MYATPVSDCLSNTLRVVLLARLMRKASEALCRPDPLITQPSMLLLFENDADTECRTMDLWFHNQSLYQNGAAIAWRWYKNLVPRKYARYMYLFIVRVRREHPIANRLH